MAKTLIADVIEPSLFADYVIERMVAKALMFRSGLISRDARIDSAIQGSGGRTINLPFWNDLSSLTSEILSDSAALTPSKIDAGQDVAVLQLRGKAFQANELAGVVAGSDPLGAIAAQVGDFWANDMQAMLNALLKGLFGSGGTLAGTHVNDIGTDAAGAPVAAELFNDDAFLDTTYLLGDRQDEFTAMIVHSIVAKQMQKLDLIDYVVPSTGAKQVGTYRGRMVIVDDGVPTIVGTNRTKYLSIVFGPGALAYSEKPAPVPVETDRDSLAGDDFLISRRHFVLHPRGVKWTGSAMAGVSPTNAELSTVANWSKVYDNKNIRVAALVTNG